MIKQFNTWHKTKLGFLVFAVVELAIAYGFGSLAIDRGNVWWYVLALAFLIGTLQNAVRLIGKLIHANS